MASQTEQGVTNGRSSSTDLVDNIRIDLFLSITRSPIKNSQIMRQKNRIIELFEPKPK
jgi:hypothetical protein